MLESITKDTLVNNVKEHLSNIMGKSTLSVLEMYMKSNNASLNDIFDKPEEVSRCLDKIFGKGSIIIKREIINIIASGYISNDNFEESIRHIIKNY